MKTQFNAKAQFDWTKRIVSLDNLSAMCERMSGVTHKFWIEKTSRSRVHVCYSNPNEYGTPDTITAVFPCYPSGAYLGEQIAVVLDLLRVFNDKDGYQYQAFDALLDCETLWRDPVSNQWRTEYEILTDRHPEFKITSSWDKDGCIQTWHSDDKEFRNYRDAQAHAIELIKALERAAK